MSKILTITNLHGEEMPVWTFDFETYYEDNRKGFSLSNPKITTTMYVRDPRFKAHGCAFIDPEGFGFWVTHNDLPAFFASIDWTKVAVIGQNTYFDAFIAYHHYGVEFGYYIDTMSMSYGEWSTSKRASLKAICKRLGLKGKIAGSLEATSGIRNLSCEQERALVPYAIQDAEETKAAFEILYFDRGYPAEELHIIDVTIRAYAVPVLEIDAGLCRAEIEDEDRRLKELLESDVLKGAQLSDNCNAILETDGVSGLMRSRGCFAEMLRSRGVAPPMKPMLDKNKQPKLDDNGDQRYTYAFAKTDIELQNLGEDSRVSDLVAMWSGLKSTIRKTRAERFLFHSEYGTAALPVMLKYCGAHTMRWSGGDKINLQNLPSGRDGRGKRLREAIMAPPGYVLAVVDSSQIECFPADSSILTKNGQKSILTITNEDLLWDGHEWVEHDGVIFKGYSEVIEYAGLRATPDHIVYIEGGGTLTFAEAKMDNAKLLVGARGGEPVRTLDYQQQSNFSGLEGKQDLGDLRNLRDREAGERKRLEEREVKELLWEEEGRRKRLLQNYPREIKEAALSTVQQDNKRNRSKMHQSCIQIIQRTWNSEQVRKLRSLCAVYARCMSERGLCWLGSGSNQQRWPLRTWELTAAYAGAKCSEAPLQSYSRMAGRTDECLEAPQRLRSTWMSRHNDETCKKRFNSGGDNSVLQVKKEAVYDILNAGPRNRFTANGYIVSNCRTNAWLWGQEDLLQIFREGGDPYAMLAAKLYGVPVVKGGENGHLRATGKAMELGLGFGMGPDRFLDGCLSGSITGDVIEMDKQQAVEAVKFWRTERNMIVEGWFKLKDMLNLMAAKMADHPLGPMHFYNEKILMPNGLYLNYENIHYMSKTDNDGNQSWDLVFQSNTTWQGEKVWTRTWHSRTDENIVQCLARIIVATQAMEVAKRYRIVLLVHDEVIYLVPEKEAEEGFQFGLKALRTAPEWCSDIPLDAEGGYAKNYVK